MLNIFTDSSEKAKRFRQKIKLVLLLLSSSPALLLAAWSFYGHHYSNKFTNYGRLLDKKVHFPFLAGLPADEDKWKLFAYTDQNFCDDLCKKQLFLIRQIRLGVGSKAIHLDRFFFLPRGFFPIHQRFDVPFHIGTFMLPVNPSKLAALPFKRGLYLADPHGWVILAWPTDANPSLLMKDIDKIMKFY